VDIRDFDLKGYLRRRAERVNRRLEELLDRSLPAGRLADAVRHSLMAGGKRLRPVLCIAAAEAVGTADDDVLCAGCSLEMIHTYSLIHDDLPALDDDDLRRGKPTCHRAFDEATAVLAGDALLTLAFETASGHGCGRPEAAAAWLEVCHTMAKAAGASGMIEGQMRDLAAESRILSLEELARMHGLKTGAMIEAAVRCGALLAGADEGRRASLSRYAKKIGLAFQVVDDILNVTGDPARLGKAVGTDRKREKSTYPALLGLEASRELAQRLAAEALHALREFDKRAHPLRALAAYVVRRNH
jgi:geranylgeranyl diphosphate synthase type II